MVSEFRHLKDIRNMEIYILAVSIIKVASIPEMRDRIKLFTENLKKISDAGPRDKQG